MSEKFTIPYCPDCQMQHGAETTCQAIEDRFDGYPIDCMINELLETEYKLSAANARIAELECEKRVAERALHMLSNPSLYKEIMAGYKYDGMQLNGNDIDNIVYAIAEAEEEDHASA